VSVHGPKRLNGAAARCCRRHCTAQGHALGKALRVKVLEERVEQHDLECAVERQERAQHVCLASG
jgi:hypothetical protein